MALPAFENLVEDNPTDSLPSFEKLVEDSPELPPVDKLVEDQPDTQQIDTEVSNIMAAPHGELPQPVLRGAPIQSDLSRSDTIPPDAPTADVIQSLREQPTGKAELASWMATQKTSEAQSLETGIAANAAKEYQRPYVEPTGIFQSAGRDAQWQEMQRQYQEKVAPLRAELDRLNAPNPVATSMYHEYEGGSDEGAITPEKKVSEVAQQLDAENGKLRGMFKALNQPGRPAWLTDASGNPIVDKNGRAAVPLTPAEIDAERVSAKEQQKADVEAERQKNIKLLGREPAWWETFPRAVRGMGADLLAEGMQGFQNNVLHTEGLHDQIASMRASAHDSNVIAGLGKGVANDVARGTADVLVLMAANPAGKAGILAAAFKGAELARARTYDETGDENKANQAALNSLITLPILLATGQAASKFASGLLPEGASALKVGATELAAGTTANVGTDLLIHAVEGQPYDWRSFTADALFALHGAWGRFAEAATAKGDTAGAATANQAQEKIGEALGQKDPEMQRLAENLQKASTPTGEPNAQQIDQTGTPDGGVQPRSEVSQLPTSQGSEGVQPSGQGGLAPEAQPAAPQETPVASRPEIQEIVDDPLLEPLKLPEPAAPQGAGLRPIQSSEAGGIFTPGRPKYPRLLGGPPSGAREFLKIPSAIKRLPTLLHEGAEGVLSKVKNPIGQQLAKRVNVQHDVESELAGRMYKLMQDGVSGMTKDQMDVAYQEAADYLRNKENGRPTAPLAPDAQRVVSAWEDVAEMTGLLSRRHNVQVADAGGYRPMRLLGRNYLPRTFNPEFLNVIRNPGTPSKPNKNTARFNAYAQELVNQRGISPAEAASLLNDMAGQASRYGANDFMGNLELARQQKFPESFYDYDLRRVASKYVNNFANRMGQIIAYGQRLGEHGQIQPNLWDVARREVQGGDETTGKYLNEAEAQATNERQPNKGIRRLQALSTGLYLSNPITTVPRNVISGLVTSAELLGTRRTFKAVVEALDKTKMEGARESGVIREDMATMLHADQMLEPGVDNVLRSFVNGTLKASGYSASENTVRLVNDLAAKSFARDFAAEARANPDSRKARQMASVIQRHGVDPQAVLNAGGDWKTSSATRRFIRQVVNSAQGSYRFHQVPLWAGTPNGRFFYQFGRWATQRAQSLVDNVLKPAIFGTETTLNGKKIRVRDFKPLIKAALGVVATGEAYAALANFTQGRDRKDATFKEIVTAKEEKGWKEMMNMVGTRMMNDTLMGGMLGSYTTPVDFANTAIQQAQQQPGGGRPPKNPLEPPVGGTITALKNLALDATQQGTITSRDVATFMKSFFPGPQAIVDTASANLGRLQHALPENETVKNIAEWWGAPLYEAENDVRTLRAAAIRFAQQEGLDVAPQASPDRIDKTPRTPFFKGLEEDLLRGDSDAARQRYFDYLETVPPEKMKATLENIRSSVQQRQPFRMGNYTGDNYKVRFNIWAKDHLPKDDQEQIERVQQRYELAARQLGLWKKD